MELDLFALLVKDYDDAIRFFVEALRFDLIEDSSSMKDDCGPERVGYSCHLGGRHGRCSQTMPRHAPSAP